MALYSPLNTIFMDRAIELANLGTRSALPNPCVGCVVVHDEEIIGEGYHQIFGGPHAEVHAITSVRDRDRLPLSTLYVTLEPCSHYGKTPPCVDRILESGIRRVVVGCRDPFHAVAGRGIDTLESAGVEVVENIRHDECILINKRFILAHSLRRPYVIIKWAQTTDGFLAPAGGARTQISSYYSQLLVHHWRGQEMCVAVGSATVRSDDPLLTVRHTDLFAPHELPAHNPLRVVIGEATRIPSHCLLCNAPGATMLFSTNPRKARHSHPNCRVLSITSAQPMVPQVLRLLYEQSILSVLVEGGAETLRHFIETDLWDEARVFTAPVRFGGGTRAPKLAYTPRAVVQSGDDTLRMYQHPELAQRLGLRE